VHNLFLVYFVNFIYKLYMFRSSPGPSSGGTTVFMRHLVLVILYSKPDSQLYRITSTKCRIIQLFLLMMDLERSETSRAYK